MRTVLICAALFAWLTPPARAETWLLPRDGLTVHASHPVAFAIYLDADYAGLPYDVDVAVARDAAFTDVVARYEAEPVAGFPAVYSATPAERDAWTSTPGTYYWRASYGDETYTPRSLTVVAAPPPDSAGRRRPVRRAAAATTGRAAFDGRRHGAGARPARDRGGDTPGRARPGLPVRRRPGRGDVPAVLA